MALDVARIVRYADADGRMHATPQRQHLVFVDGIIGGQGDGPLKPSPKHRGLVLFADDPPLADYTCAAMMGFDPARIPLVRESFCGDEFRLTDADFGSGELFLQGTSRPLCSLTCAREEAFEAPTGWQGAIEQQPVG
jgi:hypothetical protein